MNMDKFFRPVPNKIPQINPELFLNLKDPEETQKEILVFLKEFEAKQSKIDNKNKTTTIINIIVGVLNAILLIWQILLIV